MGSFDVYCAICGGPFTGIAIAHRPRTPGFRRRQALGARRAARLARGESLESERGPQNDKDDAMGGLDTLDNPSDEALGEGEVGEIHEDYTYDPEIITQDQVAWTERVYVLGRIEGKEGFISGPGGYTDYGVVDIEAGSDPSLDGMEFISCYWNEDGDFVFPFHWSCFEILAQCLTGSLSTTSVDKALLALAMTSTRTDYCCRLNINYGEPDPPLEQFWLSTAGEELFGADPAQSPALTEAVNQLMDDTSFVLPDMSVDLLAKSLRDPFQEFPAELLHHVMHFLSTADQVSLFQASWYFNLVFRHDQEYWKRRILDEFPWFHELRERLDSNTAKDDSLKRVYLWALNATRPRLYMSGCLMWIANRRRIWGACEEISNLYANVGKPEATLSP